MSGTKEFFDLISKDKDVKIELGTETLRALTALIAEKGLKDEAQKAIKAVTSKVAKEHGIDLNDMEELSEDELRSVAGGECTTSGNQMLECTGCSMIKKRDLMLTQSKFYH